MQETRPLDPHFVHLRLHSEYSISDGIVRIDPVVQYAAGDGQGALALTDLANLFGLVRFYKAARARGVKPIAGCDVWVSHGGDASQKKPCRALLLVRNRQGYLALCTLLSRAWLENASHGVPQIRFEWFVQTATPGLIALSGAERGDIGTALAAGQRDEARRLAQRWAAAFPGAFYIELQRYGQPGAETYIDGATELAAELALPVVATHPVQFLVREEFRAHEARTCIAEGEILANPRRARRFTSEQYFKSQAEMTALFADSPSALANAVEIAKRCNLELELGKSRLPLFPTPEGITLDTYLEAEAAAGLARRLAQPVPDEAARNARLPMYSERLTFETRTIIAMGFAGYFLIVADFIAWARNNGVPVGPGRGSGAGSVVAWSLGITDLDPLQYGLLFERFLNPERVSMPDFDIDFCQEGRDKVIDYVKHKYGAESVAQIATFGTLAAKAAVRDIGRVLDLPFNFVDGIATLSPFKPGRLVTIADARREEPLLAEREAREEEVRELLALAEQVEGITRNVGMHAGGVLIAPGKLTDFTPLYVQPGSDHVISQYDKDDVEAAGLVKFDFLGLTTLTILEWTSEHIRALHDDQRDFALARIPLDDAKSYEVFRRAETVAVFQFESPGMRRMLVDARPDRFGDIIALVALYRPGPMDLIPEFIARKNGAKFEYPDPRVAHVLAETYGIMVYQEQVMQMAQILGGYSLGSADLLRRAMGKKKKEEMDEHQAIFVEGAKKNGLAPSHAKGIFELMAKFAGYGFNKSHAAAYALLAVQTAWLKTHFAAEFMAANLSAAQDDTDKVKVLIEDARRQGLVILPPDLNASGHRFMPVIQKTGGDRARAIRYGLCAIKGTGAAAIASIVAARESGAGAGPFTDLFDLCARVDKRLVNRRVLEALVRAGALDSLSRNGSLDRAGLFATVGRAMEAAEHAESHANQVSLFGGDDKDAHMREPVRVPVWDEKRTLSEEKLALGFYLSGHLFKAHEAEVRCFARTPLSALAPSREPQTFAGIVSGMRTQMNRRGKMLIVTLDDASAQVEVTVFNELYEANRQRLREDELIVVIGVARNDEFSGGMRIAADTVLDLAMARARYARSLRLSMNGASDAMRLQQLLAAHRPVPAEPREGPAGRSAGTRRNGSRVGEEGAGKEEGCPITIRYRSSHDTGGAMCELQLGSAWRVVPDERLMSGLVEWLAADNVQLLYA